MTLFLQGFPSPARSEIRSWRNPPHAPINIAVDTARIRPSNSRQGFIFVWCHVDGTPQLTYLTAVVAICRIRTDKRPNV